MFDSHCGYCNTKTSDINNFFCIKNRGACENCYIKVRRNKKRNSEKSNLAYWSKIRRADETVDKNLA